jgi:hypothetical protein
MRFQTARSFSSFVEKRLCNHCIYYEPTNAFKPELNMCRRFGGIDYKTGRINYDLADTCRKQEDKCGKKAKCFESIMYS